MFIVPCKLSTPLKKTDTKIVLLNFTSASTVAS